MALWHSAAPGGLKVSHNDLCHDIYMTSSRGLVGLASLEFILHYIWVLLSWTKHSQFKHTFDLDLYLQSCFIACSASPCYLIFKYCIPSESVFSSYVYLYKCISAYVFCKHIYIIVLHIKDIQLFCCIEYY